MGILHAAGIRRRVKEMRAFARVISFLSGELRYRRDILTEAFARVAKKCMPPFEEWLTGISDDLKKIQDVCEMPDSISVTDFDQIWEHKADELYIRSGLKKEDMEYIYNLGQMIGYLDVQAQEEGFALLAEEVGRHIRKLEDASKEQIKIACVAGAVAGVLLVIILV